MKRFFLTTAAALLTAFGLLSMASVTQAQTIYQFSTTISSSVWLNAANWTVGPGGPVSPVFPGLDISAATTTNGTATDIATFGALVSGTPASNGINFNTAGGGLTLGTIVLISSANRAVSTGNSSGAAGQTMAVLTLTGQTWNAVPNTIVANDSTFGLTLKPFQGGSVAPMTVALGNVTDNVVQINGTGNITISSVIQNGSGNHLSLQGPGSGTLILSGANTYTGGTTVSSAILRVSNATGTSATGTGAVTFNGGVLDGNGFINVGGNMVTFNSGSTLAPFNATVQTPLTIIGTQTVASSGYTSTLNLKTGSTFRALIGATFGQVALTGTVDITGSTLAVNITAGSEPAIGATFVILNNDGSDAVTGVFASGGNVTANNGQMFSVSYTGGDGNDIVLTALSDVPDFVLNSAASVKTHGAAGTFAIDLPLTGAPGIECRSSGGNYTLVFTFNNDVASGDASVTSGTGTVGTPTFSTNTMTVPLTGVTDIQRLTVTLENVTDTSANVLADTPVTMGVLIGDVNGNGTVNAGDVSITKGQASAAAPVSSTNFRDDVNVNGTINAGDVAIVKSNSGHVLPP